MEKMPKETQYVVYVVQPVTKFHNVLDDEKIKNKT
jgi:hypothetical protein